MQAPPKQFGVIRQPERGVDAHYCLPYAPQRSQSFMYRRRTLALSEHAGPDFLNIPVYRLYGEERARSDFGFFHIETLAVRNAPNMWHIKPHRHLDFDQMSILLDGHCSFSHDGREGTAKAVSCVYTPAKVVHQFHYSPGSLGFVITISSDFSSGLPSVESASSPGFLPLIRNRVVTLRSDVQIANLNNLLDLLSRVARSTHRHRREELRLLVSALLLEFDSVTEEQNGPRTVHAATAEAELVRCFNELLQSAINAADLNRTLTIEMFAAQLCVTRYTLNAACQSVCGCPARAVIQNAILDQATRLLLYSTLPVKEISFALGYSHASHFTRFFKQRRGYSPEAFRQEYVTPNA
jgi:AraC family transcriptional regulator, transcriptional activator of pobA